MQITKHFNSFLHGRTSNILGWIATIAMGAAAVALLISFGLGNK